MVTTPFCVMLVSRLPLEVEVPEPDATHHCGDTRFCMAACGDRSAWTANGAGLLVGPLMTHREVIVIAGVACAGAALHGAMAVAAWWWSYGAGWRGWHNLPGGAWRKC